MRSLFITTAVLLTLAFAGSAQANPWSTIDIVGGVGPGEFRAPLGISADSDGNLYVLEQDIPRVQKLNANGDFVTKWGHDGGAAGELNFPYDAAVSDAGVYVSDNDNNRIQRFDKNGNFVSAWGWGVSDGAATYQVCTSDCRAGIAGAGAGQLDSSRGIGTDGTYVYVADTQNKRVQKFDTAGNYVGQWTVGAQQRPERVFAAGGKVYVSTVSDVVWRFDTSGNPDSGWDGDGVTGSPGSGPGQFSDPESIAVDATGVYVADSGNQRIVKLDASGAFMSAWGSGGNGAGQFNDPYGVVASGGSVWVADSYNHRIQKFSQGGTHQLTVGSVGAGDFYYPLDVAVAPSGDVYVADTADHDLQRLSSTGAPLARWSTGAGSYPWSVTPTSQGVWTGTAGDNRMKLYDPSGSLLSQIGSGGAGPGQFGQVRKSAVDSSGNLYVAERYNNRVQKVDSAGDSLAIFGSPGSGDGQFSNPVDVALDSDGNVYVADSGNHRIQKLSPSGEFLTKWGSKGSGDGEFDDPTGIEVDSRGNVFVADHYNHRIQQFDRSGNFVAKWGSKGDGPGELLWPFGVSEDADGGLWVVDSGNHRLVRFCCPGANSPSTGGSGGSGGTTTGSGGGISPADTTAPRIKLSGASLLRARRIRKSGLALRVTSNEPATVTLRASLSRRDARRLGLRSASIARASSTLTAAGTRSVRVKLTAAARRALLKLGARKVRIVVRASAIDRAGNRSAASLTVTVRR